VTPLAESPISATLGALAPAAEATLARLARDRIVDRIVRGDHTVWKSEPTEISNRLGWLTIADRMRAALPEIDRVVADVRRDGYTHLLLLGMGGSSLAPETFARTFGTAPGYLELRVLDSTDPDAVREHQAALDPARTLFIVSTKSGGTVETFSFFRYFYRWTVDTLGAARAGAHFVAITDPGSALADTATQYHFRATFLADPDIGGRYSALSHFGLVPAAMIGADVPRLLEQAVLEATDRDGATRLGAIIGAAAAAGRDKLTFVLSAGITAFAAWVEQLVAESTGKEGRGVLPVADEPLGAPAVYGADRLFVQIALEGDTSHDAALTALSDAGHPVVRIVLSDAYQMGAEIVRWELATAIVGWSLGINPFDQPNVEAAKALAREMIKAYHEHGTLPTLTPTASGDALAVYATTPPSTGGATVSAVVRAFVGGIRPGDYVALQAYVAPSDETMAALQRLRVVIRDRWRVATTVGYGPRFLHSTGQLHKGDAGHGVFLQLVTKPTTVVPIPDTADADTSTMTFGVLKEAQALGDRQALLDAHRRVLRVDPAAVPGDIGRLATLVT